PVISVPSTITKEAGSSGSIAVSYTVTATDDTSLAAGSPSCSPASGSLFTVGTHTVNCTATDTHGNSSTASFQIIIVQTPPVISAPANITMTGTSSAGAVVTYSASASDPDDATSTLTFSCSPASGSTFGFGTTPVNCSASDPAGNSSTASFTVTVNDTPPT